MKTSLIMGAFGLCFVAPLFGQVTAPPVLSADEVVVKMAARDAQRESLERGYTGNRRYVLDNSRMHKRAEMLVRIRCDSDGSKHFDVLSEEGWKPAHKHVLRKMLESETETSRPQTRPATRVTADNYEFRLSGSEVVDGRVAYAIEVSPKRHDKFLFTGRIWVDAEDFALMRAEGKPAKNPSFWIRSVYFVHRYQKAGLFWFPFSTESITDARVFGFTEVLIRYFDYVPNSQTSQESRRSPADSERGDL